MRRAAIVIGVRQTGSLGLLAGAISGAHEIGDWLENREGFEVTRLTDENGAVTAAALTEAVTKVVDRCVYDQLVLYFAGHGFVQGLSEYWLLSGAPRNANEAVIVNESVDLARGSGIPSVVFISDACRSTVDSLAAQRVRGSIIFPNDPPTGEVGVAVDRFFATHVGDGATELRVDDSVGAYDGVFTRCFQDAFKSPPGSLCRTVMIAGEEVDVVPNRRLSAHLRAAVPKVLAAKAIRRRQRPDAIIESDEDVYIGRAIVMRSTREHLFYEPAPDPLEATSIDFGLRSTAPDRTRGLLRAAEHRFAWDEGPDSLAYEPFPGDTGFRVLGARIEWAEGLKCSAVIKDQDIYIDQAGALSSVVIGFVGGTGTVLAALRGYLATVIVDAGRVRQVSYMRMSGMRPWENYDGEGESLRALRRIAAIASRNGVFRVESEVDARRLANQIRVMKAIDPTLGLYAVYAYAASGAISSIWAVQRDMHYDIHGALYDVALLAGARPDPTRDASVSPFVPMLSQGWPLLRARRGVIPAAAEQAADHLLESLWTTFAAPGMAILRAAIANGVLR